MAVTITRTPWIDDDGTGTTGTVLNNAVKTELYNQIDGALAQVPAGAAMGLWQDVPFSAANFGAQGGGTWTVAAGAVAANRYTIIGKTMIWAMYISWFSGGNTVAGTVTAITIKYPAGATSPGLWMFRRQFAGGVAGSEVDIEGTGPEITMKPSAGGAFAAGPAGLITVLTFPIL